MSIETITPDTYVETIPERYQNTYKRAIGGSRTAAVKAFCQHCQGYSEGTTKAIRECPTTWCPLWSVRPYQDKDRAVEAVDVDGDEIENENSEEETEQEVMKPKRVPSQAFLESRRGRVRDPERDGRVRELADRIEHALNSKTEWRSKGETLLLMGCVNKAVIPDAEWTEALNLLTSEGRIEAMGVKRGRRYRRVS